MMSATISPHAAAPASNQLIVAVAGVAGVMVDVDDEVPSRPATPGRDRSPHSSTMSASYSPSTASGDLDVLDAGEAR